jgi:Flp pilus assembly protein TadD
MAVGKSVKRLRVRILILASAGVALSAAPSVALAQAVPVYAESPADALARNVRILAKDPKDFNALIGAGKAALQIGDGQAAAGFFWRAQERWPSSPLPLIGMGAALVHEGDANGALTHFRRAEALGAAPVVSFGADRGLAYDLLGRTQRRRADYRAALGRSGSRRGAPPAGA